jgi:hypothetical protein
VRVCVESVLPCPPELVWDEVQRPGVLVEVARPLVTFAPVDASVFPDRWTEGRTVRCRVYLFGVVPLGLRTIVLERVDGERREIQSRERDRLIRRWDHLVRVRPEPGGRTRYRDEIVIQAGVLTLPVWVFARWFYRHRQRRWRAVARRLHGGVGVKRLDPEPPRRGVTSGPTGVPSG